MRLDFEWLLQEMPFIWQWIGLFATIAGALLSLWAVVSARGAKRQAQEAKEAALRSEQILQLVDLIQDMSELQGMLGRDDFLGIAAKASTVKGRVVRYRMQASSTLAEGPAEILTLPAINLRSSSRCPPATGRSRASGKVFTRLWMWPRNP